MSNNGTGVLPILFKPMPPLLMLKSFGYIARAAGLIIGERDATIHVKMCLQNVKVLQPATTEVTQYMPVYGINSRQQLPDVIDGTMQAVCYETFVKEINNGKY